MERHSLPDAGTDGAGRSGPRRRRIMIATALVLTLAAGTGIAASTGLLSFAESCEDSAVRLDLAVSPDLAPVVRAAAHRVRDKRVTSDGRCMDIRVDARENHEIARELSDHDKEPKYEAWLPDSAIWAVRADGLGRGVPLTAAGSVAVSPVGIATDRSAGTSLGWPGKTYTWSQLATATTASETVHLGTADPARSATGILALAGIASSYARESGSDSWEDRTDTEASPAPGKPTRSPQPDRAVRSAVPDRSKIPKKPTGPSGTAKPKPTKNPKATDKPKKPKGSPAPGRSPSTDSTRRPAEPERTSDANASLDADAKIAATARLLAQRLAPADSQILRTLSAPGSSRNEAVFLSEQAAFTHNFTASDKDDLDLFYPTDGALRLDYPYHLVDADDLTLDESRAASRFLALLGDSVTVRDLTSHGFRPSTGTAPYVLVHTAGGRPPQPYARSATGIDPVSRDLLQEMLGMWTVTVQSARLTTVVDVSGSMQSAVPGRGGETRLDATRASLLRVIDQFSQEDEIGLWEFATGLDGPRDYREIVPTARLGASVNGKPNQRARLTEAFTALKPVPNGATGLYDSTLAAYQSAQAGYARGKFNALILLTDGANQDRYSISRSTLISRLKGIRDTKRPVPLIAIAIGPTGDEQELDEIAEATGGAGYQVSDPSDVQAVILKAITAVGQSSQLKRD
ncbi:VWA domain-containing protein [Streptomyces albipurpureus]|uniref:VWA domain-containing protein n=1 Tax=Streptomyces albipurpureus TaxID=2897419 RepID=A0ABT0UH88_9ACTN|nr:VWA domain-containing protein [Streptomyces sp. CWNU-1]MCM2387691.1 VWA domain-containing protein [Streptomyces sp. CWNU-1]